MLCNNPTPNPINCLLNGFFFGGINLLNNCIVFIFAFFPVVVSILTFCNNCRLNCTSICGDININRIWNSFYNWHFYMSLCHFIDKSLLIHPRVQQTSTHSFSSFQINTRHFKIFKVIWCLLTKRINRNLCFFWYFNFYFCFKCWFCSNCFCFCWSFNWCFCYWRILPSKIRFQRWE